MKAVYDGIEEVYYKPTEIITIWGQLSRTSQSHKITIGTAIVISLIALLVFVRKNARKGYKPLDDGDNWSCVCTIVIQNILFIDKSLYLIASHAY